MPLLCSPLFHDFASANTTARQLIDHSPSSIAFLLTLASDDQRSLGISEVDCRHMTIRPLYLEENKGRPFQAQIGATLSGCRLVKPIGQGSVLAGAIIVCGEHGLLRFCLDRMHDFSCH
jgi:hypothetical protein